MRVVLFLCAFCLFLSCEDKKSDKKNSVKTTKTTVKITEEVNKLSENTDDTVNRPYPKLNSKNAMEFFLGYDKKHKENKVRLTTDFGKIDIVDELKTETWASYNGWYMDLPAVGERLLKPMEFYDASNLLTLWSQVPAKGSDVDPNVESCESTSVDSERQYRTFVNIMDGKRPSVQIVDKNSDGAYDSSDGGVSRKKVAKGPHSIIKKDKFENVDIDAKNNKEKLAALPEESLRPSWRQIQ